MYIEDILFISFLLFVSSFFIVLFLGFQSQVVRIGHKFPAFLLSLGVGVMQIFSFKLVPNANTIELVAFVLGGAIGIVSSIELHTFYCNKRGINDTRGLSQGDTQ